MRSYENLNRKIKSATKWSILTEIAAKLVLPITNMVFARLLTPEAFGIVATITMITTFLEIFSDAGFQKYLIQKEFSCEKDKAKTTTVAFWTNLIISFLLWFVIILFKDPLAVLVGSPGMGNAIAIACISLPLMSFSSIQMALYKREFDFKTLFITRIFGISIPIFITIPLAYISRSYWALIIGTILVNFSNAIILTKKSSWKPSFFYDFLILKKMLRFSIWTLIEQISIWLTSYVGIFIVAINLNTHYLGLYKTSMTTVNQITSLITSATMPILFSALSRLQDNESEFKHMFFKFQRRVSILIIPLGVGIFLYRDLVTAILLGPQWEEAAGFIGLWGLFSSLTIVLSYYSSEVYRAKGKPKLSVLAQVLHLLVLIPVLVLSSKMDFETLYFWRSVIRIQLIAVNLVIMYIVFKISTLRMLVNIFPSIVSALAMMVFAYWLQEINHTFAWDLFSIILCILFYFCFIMLFPQIRKEVFGFFAPYIKRFTGEKKCIPKKAEK